jgi:nucleoside-diphosphate-sugar epimerase
MTIETIKALITGSSGFVGGRIAERLWLDYGVTSNCLIQNYSKAARLARLPVKMHRGNLLDKDSLFRAIEGCNVVFNCAYGNTPDPALNRQINEDGLVNLAEISLEKGVERFIHFSSVAVYGSNPPMFVNEATPVEISDDEYGKSKIRTEEICHDFLGKGLPTVIIRPTVVFGPFSPIWTVGVIKRVKAGGWERTPNADGLCNHVYIDDLINGIFLCIANDSAVGETFILSGDEPVTWNEYFGIYRLLTGLPISSTPRSHNVLRSRTVISHIFRANIRILRKYFEPQLKDIYELLKYKHPDLARNLHSFLIGGIGKNEIVRFSNKTVYSITKAKKTLGYSPRSFEEGMRLTADWLRYHEYI